MKKTIKTWQMIMNFRRMRYIRRCNNFPTFQQEDVAQHSYYVTMLAMLFKDECDRFNSEGVKTVIPCRIDGELLLRKCLLHDTEEAFTSDIPYPVKHCDETVHSTLESNINQTMLDATLQASDTFSLIEWEVTRQECKNETEGKVVALCDMLELALYSYEEVMMGNKAMEVMLDNCNLYLEDLIIDAVRSVFPNTDCHFQEVVPTIWKLFHLVQRDSETGEYIFKGYVTDLMTKLS